MPKDKKKNQKPSKVAKSPEEKNNKEQSKSFENKFKVIKSSELKLDKEKDLKKTKNKNNTNKKKLIVVESPTKVKTLNRFLNNEYKIIASVGHIRDLPKKELGINIEDNFSLMYETIPGKEEIIKNIKMEAKKADKIILASDPDREGEAIAWHITTCITEEIPKPKEAFERILLEEITEKGIKEALQNPRGLNDNLINAQQARRALDRLVGYLISPLLWQLTSKRLWLSAGRVQTVALKLICEREEKIEKFVPEEYWNVQSLFETKNKEQFWALLLKRENKPYKPKTKEETDEIIEKIKNLDAEVSKYETKKVKKYAPPPLITSTLQQEANKRYSMGTQQIMRVAQQLYEGIDLGEKGQVGLITYMRTDSTRLSLEAIKNVRKYISTNFSKEYLPDKPIIYKSKRTAQEAHEAIRPTDVNLTPESIKKFLTKDQFKIYQLIWQRFVACQMSHSEIEKTIIQIKVDDFTFQTSSSRVLFDGYLKIYGDKKDLETGFIPKVKVKDKLKVIDIKGEQNFTKPPSRFTDGTLVKELEENGIGRPSTYAPIIGVLIERGYVKREDNFLVPTTLGKIIKSVLIKLFRSLFEINFTANMEEQLDKIEEGKTVWTSLIKDFYNDLNPQIKKVEKNLSKIKEEIIGQQEEECPRCGNRLVLKWSKEGPFLGCSNYPECKYTKPLREEENQINEIKKQTEGKNCPLCGSELVLKKGPKGFFLGCSNYPNCKFTENLKKNEKEDKKVEELSKKIEGKNCPECGNALVIKRSKYGFFIACSNYPECKYTRSSIEESVIPCPECKEGKIYPKKTKRNRIFYGCSKYPECKFAIWNPPVQKECPECKYPVMEEIRNKSGKTYKCPECSFKIEKEN